MPRANCFSGSTVANENRVYGRTEKALDERRGSGVGREIIAERPDDRALFEHRALLEQPRSSRCKADALPLERLQCVQLRLEGRVQLFGAEKLRARRDVALTRLLKRVARALGSGGGFCGACGR